MYQNGKHYIGKGYYHNGEFVTNNDGEKTYKLGYYHGCQIAKRASMNILKKVVKHKPYNDYERGKIQAIKNALNNTI
ncbi:MAG: hypothetical protein ACTSSF_00390 [Candidatus Heimdallarchaeaceae archaeon]